MSRHSNSPERNLEMMCGCASRPTRMMLISVRPASVFNKASADYQCSICGGVKRATLIPGFFSSDRIDIAVLRPSARRRQRRR